MPKKIQINLDTWLAILLLIATITIIILQIAFSGPDSTKLETSLFSILQFTFSLAFSWLIARASLRQEFQESQKKFAISAYRRITEINMGVERLLHRANSRMQSANMETHHELDVIYEIIKGIRESIKSSVSDWADIIGEEIVIVEKIQALREQQDRQEQKAELFPKEQSESDQSKTDKAELQIEKLLSLLPNPLRLTADEISSKRSERFQSAKKRLKEEETREGFIKLTGFYEIDAGLQSDIYQYLEGDILQVRIGDAKSRVGSLIVYDAQGQSVGIIMNKLPGVSESYFDSVNLLIRYLQRSQFDVEILSIDRNDDNKGKRHYFTAKILPRSMDPNGTTNNNSDPSS